MSANASLSGIPVQPAALLRLLCALLVALVTVTHTCGMASAAMTSATMTSSDVASAREVGPVAIVLDGGSDDSANVSGSSDDAGMAAEKCHLCSVVQLPAVTMDVALLPVRHQVPVAITRDLLSFSPSATSPPPRTLT